LIAIIPCHFGSLLFFEYGYPTLPLLAYRSWATRFCVPDKGVFGSSGQLQFVAAVKPAIVGERHASAIVTKGNSEIEVSLPE
jgi:hypothetical protein